MIEEILQSWKIYIILQLGALDVRVCLYPMLEYLDSMLSSGSWSQLLADAEPGDSGHDSSNWVPATAWETCIKFLGSSFSPA